MSPEEAEGIIGQYLRPCAGCGKDTVLDGHHLAWASQRKTPEHKAVVAEYPEKYQRVLKAKSAAAFERVTMTHEVLYLCAGRGPYGVSEACFQKAVATKRLCPVCGTQTHTWPMPCDTCVRLIRRYQEQDAINTKRTDQQSVRIIWRFDGLNFYIKPDESTVIRDLLSAFGAAKATRKETLTIPTGMDPHYSSSYPLFILDKVQYDALTALYRWMDTALKETAAKAFSTGSNLLGRILTGESTMEGINDQVAKKAAEVQAAKDKAPQAWVDQEAERDPKG